MTRQLLVEKRPSANPDAGATGSASARVPSAGPAGDSGPAAGCALGVVDLTKHFRSGFARRHQRGIEGVSFTVGRGEVYALLGHNGAGKTTTIGCLLDLVRAERGHATLLGRPHRDRQSRAGVGYLPERPYFADHLTGRELLEFHDDLLELPRAGRRDRLDALLRQVGLLDDAGRRLSKYSKGMLQRLGLAQALLGEPELLILDEPMSGLDPLGRREVRSLLQDLKRQGRTILLSSHIVPDVEQLADAVGILREGRLVLDQRLDDPARACTYRVRVAAAGAAVAAAALPPWAPAPGDGAGDDARTSALMAADADRLRQLLDACHRAGLPVLGVDTVRTGLEDLYLRANAPGGQA